MKGDTLNSTKKGLSFVWQAHERRPLLLTKRPHFFTNMTLYLQIRTLSFKSYWNIWIIKAHSKIMFWYKIACFKRIYHIFFHIIFFFSLTILKPVSGISCKSYAIFHCKVYLHTLHSQVDWINILTWIEADGILMKRW